MKRVQLKIQEEKEKEKKIYAKMFAWAFFPVLLLTINTSSQPIKLQSGKGNCRSLVLQLDSEALQGNYLKVLIKRALQWMV